MTALSLRWRIIVAILALTLGTTVALSLLARYFLNWSLESSVNLETGQALEDALALAKENYTYRKQILQAAGDALLVSPELGALARSDSLGDARSILSYLGIRDAEVRVLSPDQLGEQEADTLRAGRPIVYKTTDPSDRLVLLVPVMDASDLTGVVQVSQGLAELVNVERATQTYEHLRLIEPKLQRAFLLVFLLAAAGIVAVACVVGIRVGFSVTNPLYGLVRGTRELARDNLSYRIQKEREDEIGLLIDSFNRMAGDLEENQRIRVEAEKMVAWQEIARRLAHEIKNPLTPIQLTIQQMRDKYQGSDEAYRQLLKDCTEIAAEEVERLRDLVQEFAEFARLPSLALSRYDLNAVVRDAARIYPDAPIRMELQESLPELDLDPEQMHRVFINLIDNGLAAAGPTGSISLRTRLEGDKAHATVTDSGPGIAAEDRERIFEPYVSGKQTGIGLGLAIVKSVIENHNGRIRVSGRHEGGARFEITLPVPGRDAEQREVGA